MSTTGIEHTIFHLELKDITTWTIHCTNLQHPKLFVVVLIATMAILHNSATITSLIQYITRIVSILQPIFIDLPGFYGLNENELLSEFKNSKTNQFPNSQYT
eukprot:TRINITY_DN32428_c1_g1_i1.p1 TRINITY_DN32428_c1_g1~~TRINITY_DN32428_c1_g1_i1.p1  ORF type:complete len:102 (+),score=2.04 TRINITY_DN32428_c1_g1_i1:324-629(+)